MKPDLSRRLAKVKDKILRAFVEVDKMDEYWKIIEDFQSVDHFKDLSPLSKKWVRISEKAEDESDVVYE